MQIRTTIRLFVLSNVFFALLFLFQNCSPVAFHYIGGSASSSSLSVCANTSDQKCTPSSSCQFNGQNIDEDASVTAYQNSRVSFENICISESRICTQGQLSGSYNYDSCSVGTPVNCLFNGQTIFHGHSMPAYQNSSANYGSTCVSEERLCDNGALSGSYAYGSCAVDVPKSCLFNGQTIVHGQSAMAYQTSSVAYGQTCVSQNRACTNGILAGTFTFASCTIGAPSSCLFDGKTLAHGQSTPAYQNSSANYGSTCVSEERLCDNGALSGSYAYGSCAVDVPKSCLFNGQTIAHGQSTLAYQNSSANYGSTCVSEDRLCVDGALSGSYTFGSCAVDIPKSCLFNGQTIVHGQSAMAYQTSSVGYGQTCTSQSRVCTNGTLSGAYTFGSCAVDVPKSCLFNGQTIAHGQSTMAYQTSSVGYGQTCTSQSRVCTNGTLSGAYIFDSCVVQTPKSCLFDGKTVAHGGIVKAYQTSSVGYNNTCVSENRDCVDGTLSGTYAFGSCAVDVPKSCLFNGQTIVHGQSTMAYQTSSVGYGQTCVSQNRLCTNGSLNGTYTAPTCSVNACVANQGEACAATTRYYWESSRFANLDACEMYKGNMGFVAPCPQPNAGYQWSGKQCTSDYAPTNGQWQARLLCAESIMGTVNCTGQCQ